MVSHIADGKLYEYSSATFDVVTETKTNIEEPSMNVLERIDSLVEALIEPNYVRQQENNRVNGFAALLAAASTCLNEEKAELLSKATKP